MTTTQTKLKHLFIASLTPTAHSTLLGGLPDGSIYAETFSQTDEIVTYWQIAAGQTVQQIAEDTLDFANLPPDLIEPQPVPLAHPWNFSGARQRGLRAEDRINALVRPLTIMQKMTLIPRLGLAITPMQLLGIAETRLLSQVVFPAGDGVLCRMLRFAYTLPSVAQDADGLPYDYDTVALYLIHAFDPQADELPPLEDCLGNFAGVQLIRPMDCLYHNGRLVVADAGEDDTPSRIIFFEEIQS